VGELERLSGLDAGFLYMETPTLHMHTLKIGIVDPSSSPGGYSFGHFKDVLAARLHLLPPFRRRLLPVPLSLHHPLWLEDRDFDLDYHLRRVGVPQPGTQKELDELIGDIAGRPLDRARPLWQMWVVEGLEGGRVAFVTKMHHAIADGAAASALLANVMSIDADTTPAPPRRPWRGERPPPNLALLAQALVAQVRLFLLLPRLLARTWRAVREVLRRRTIDAVIPPRPILDAPRPSFNGALTPHRTFATTTLSLDRAKAVKNAAGVTLNDVILATVGGALADWLAERGEVLDRPLVAGVPVGTDVLGAEPRLVGNRVSNLFTSLATDVNDPAARLQRIHQVTIAAKEVQATLGMDLMQQWVEYTPAPLLKAFMRLYSRWRLANRHRPPINLVVSNVPGPGMPLFVDGARLTDLYSVGPVLEGAALNITVWSYEDRLQVAALACRELLPRLHEVSDRMPGALDELAHAVGVDVAAS
jgi:diacylglycerol O-acyltransferase / wax synthase